MSQNQLDLTIHDINEVAGKILSLNGVSYKIHDLADEGGETFIFPLENQTSGLIMFLAKIYKFKPTSPEFVERKNNIYYMSFLLSMIGLPTAHEEQYEIAGGMMKFQLHIPGALFMRSTFDSARQATPLPVTQRSYQEFIDRASAFVEDGKREAAIGLLEEVLSLNPEHSVALLMLGDIYHKSGHPEKVLKIVDKALAVEPNDTRFYHLAAKTYIDLRQPQDALSVLNLALHRYWWEWNSWDLKREVATRFALNDVLKEMEEEAHKRFDHMEESSYIGDKTRSDLVNDFYLRMKLTSSFYEELDKAKEELDKAKDLSIALDLLIQTLSTNDLEERFQLQFKNGQEALKLVIKWQDCWLGRIIAVLSNIFMMEATVAIQVYGGMENLSKVLESESVEGYYMQGLNAIFRGDQDKILPYFRSAVNLDPEDAFVQFGLVLGSMMDGNSDQEISTAMTKLQSSYFDHPIRKLATKLMNTVTFRCINL
jgi:tetratricopeptide (TPR) repeat protein